MSTQQPSQYDAWLRPDSAAAALVMRQYLLPVEGADAVFFPPTYAAPKGSNEDKGGYNVDEFEDGTNVVQVDSVGSQANRMEPLFATDDLNGLVPQHIVCAKERRVHILEAGHRAADAIVRFSELKEEIQSAFDSYKSGNAEALARIAPTSIVFGAWDSRGDTQAKLPRVVRSVIRAYNVRRLTRSAQYATIAGELLGEADAEAGEKGPEADLGLAHVPATRTHGGVMLVPGKGEIRRDLIINLTTVQGLAAADDAMAVKFRRYILGLALVAATQPLPTTLRQGCELVPDTSKPSAWELVHRDGTRETLDNLTLDVSREFAKLTAEEFEVAQGKEVPFDNASAGAALKAAKTDKKKGKK
jgi:CRISPR-associated protein Csb1